VVQAEQLLLGAQVIHRISLHCKLQAVPKKLGLYPDTQTLQMEADGHYMQLASMAVQLILHCLDLLS